MKLVFLFRSLILIEKALEKKIFKTIFYELKKSNDNAYSWESQIIIKKHNLKYFWDPETIFSMHI